MASTTAHIPRGTVPKPPMSLAPQPYTPSRYLFLTPTTLWGCSERNRVYGAGHFTGL
ncbi:hypothetical protein BC826DRAFT_1046245 [Russula brevipes]|nr:hypothetical protein BC826DRAFT_1046245 [Russula brevipes]